MNPRFSARSGMLALASALLVAGCEGAYGLPSHASGDACLGVAESDLARVAPSPGSASRLDEEVGKQRIRTVRGVRLVLPAEPGLTPASARRLTACRVARSGLVASELSPIVVRAREVGDAVEVTVSSEDVDVARSIVRRELSGG